MTYHCHKLCIYMNSPEETPIMYSDRKTGQMKFICFKWLQANALGEFCRFFDSLPITTTITILLKYMCTYLSAGSDLNSFSAHFLIDILSFCATLGWALPIRVRHSETKSLDETSRWKLCPQLLTQASSSWNHSR